MGLKMMGLAAGLRIRFLPVTKAHLKEMFPKSEP